MSSSQYLVILATENSESLPENIAGWRPQCGWLEHRWACLAAECRVQSPFIRAMGGH